MYDTLDKYKTPLRYPTDESSDIYNSIRSTTITTLPLRESGESHHKSLRNNQICHEEENVEFQPLRARANTAPAAIYDSVNTIANDDKYNITSFSRRRKIGAVKGLL